MWLVKEVEPSLIPWWAVLRLDVLMKLPSKRCQNFHWDRGIPNSPCNSHLQVAKEYNEIAVGGCCRNEKLQQYLENDRRVLRFHTFWDESGKYGSRKFPGLDCVAVDVLPSKKLWVLDPLTWIAQKISTSHWFYAVFFWSLNRNLQVVRYYTLHYYLADDTVEMLENLPRTGQKIKQRQAKRHEMTWEKVPPSRIL